MFVLWGVAIGGLVQSIMLPSLCLAGTYKMYIAVSVDLLVAIRFFIAVKRKERGKAWIFYAVLPILIVPIIEIIFRLCIT